MLGGLSIVGALVKVAVVFALLWITLKLVARVHRNSGGVVVRRRAAAGGGAVRPTGRLVEVMGRSALGRNTSIVVVRVGDNCLALGVSEQNVNLLSEVDLDLDLDDDDDPVVIDSHTDPARTQVSAPRPAWKDFVENLRERTVRR